MRDSARIEMSATMIDWDVDGEVFINFLPVDKAAWLKEYGEASLMNE